MCLSQFPFFNKAGFVWRTFYGAVITSSASRQERKKVISHAGQCVMNPVSVCSDVSMAV